MSNLNEFYGEIISIYTRAQAIEDGTLVDLSKLFPKTTRRHFKYPIAVTSTLFADVESCVEARNVKAGREIATVESVFGAILLAIVCKSRAQRGDCARVYFQIPLYGVGPRKLVCDCGPGDDAAPVITICSPSEL